VPGSTDASCHSRRGLTVAPGIFQTEPDILDLRPAPWRSATGHFADSLQHQPMPGHGRLASMSSCEGGVVDLLRDHADRPEPAWFNMLTGSVAWIIGRGPSATVRRWLELVERPWLVTTALNDYTHLSGETLDRRPRVWVTVDPPHYFPRNVWESPLTLKCVPMEWRYSPIDALHIRRIMPNGQPIDFTEKLPGPTGQGRVPADLQRTVFYHHSSDFLDDDWFRKPWATFGDPVTQEQDIPFHGVLPAAIRILYHLGIRRLFLLGIDGDWRTTPPQHHTNYRMHFELEADYLRRLAPVCLRFGLHVWNASPDSLVDAFPKVTFDEALRASGGPPPCADVQWPRRTWLGRFFHSLRSVT